MIFALALPPLGCPTHLSSYSQIVFLISPKYTSSKKQCPKTWWHKATILLCSQILWVRDSGRASGGNTSLVHDVWGDLTGSAPWPSASIVQRSLCARGQWSVPAVVWISAGLLASILTAYSRPLHVASLYGQVWASSQCGGWVPRMSVPRESQEEAHGIFMI